MEKLLLRHRRAPGDILVMTALVRDIHAAYPGRFRISVETPFPDLWQHNPHVAFPAERKGARVYDLSYGESIRRAKRESVHFLTGFHHDFQKKTGLPVPLTRPHPDVHLTDAERHDRIVAGRYWVVLAGGKMDFTTKHWSYARYQTVVDVLAGFGVPVVQLGGQGTRPRHFHPELRGVTSLVGKTSLRQMLRIIAGADGVICTITFAMHAAAALGRPCVVTAGGREEWWWEAYHRDNPGLGPNRHLLPVDHRYLHTIGLLDCCKTAGSWRNKVLKSEKDRSYCAQPVPGDAGQYLPRCQDMITAEKVVESALSYYVDGTLPPLDAWATPEKELHDPDRGPADDRDAARRPAGDPAAGAD